MIKKLIDQYKNLKAPVKASLWFLICGFLQKGVAVLTTPVFSRIMTESEYGRFNVYNSWLGIVQILVSLNLTGSVYTRGLVVYEQDQNRFASSIQGLSTTCILIASVLYAIFAQQINDLLGISTLLMTAMLVEAWASMAYYFWSNRERVHYRYKKMVWVTVLFVILRPLMGIIFVLLADVNCQVEARVLAVVGVNFLLFVWLYRAVARKGKCFYHKKYWKYALKFNIPLLPHYLAENVLSQSDRLMIDRILGSRETAYYSLAYTIAVVMVILNNAILSTLNPWIYQTLKKNQVNRVGSVLYGVLLLVGGANLCVILIAPEFLQIMAPPTYQAALWVIPPVTVSVYFMFMYNIFTTFEYYYAKTYYVSVSTILGAGLNVLLNAVLIPQYGFVAAGYTTLLCYILYAVVHYFILRKICKEHMNERMPFKASKIVIMSLGMLVIAFGIMLLYKTTLIRYAMLLAIGIFAIIKRRTLMDLWHRIKQ